MNTDSRDEREEAPEALIKEVEKRLAVEYKYDINPHNRMLADIRALCQSLRTAHNEVRKEIWNEAVTLTRRYAGSCPGHVQLQMFAALEAAANSVQKKPEGKNDGL